MTRSGLAIQARLLLVVFLAFLPPLGLLLAQATGERRMVVEAFRREMLVLTRTVAHQADLVVEGARQFLGSLAQIPAIREGESRACSALLSQRLREHPLYADLVVLSPDGKPRCAAKPLEPTGVGRELAPDVLRTRRFVTGRFSRVTPHRPVALLGHPLMDARGRTQGALVAAMDLGRLAALLAHRVLPEEASLLLLDTRGTVLAHSRDPESVGRRALEASQIPQAAGGDGSGVIETTGPDGTRYLLAHAPFRFGEDREGAVQLVIRVPADRIHAAAGQVFRRGLVWLGIVAGLVGGIVWGLSDRVVVRPIGSLVATARRIAAGDFSARALLSSPLPGFEELRQAFEEMSRALEARERERGEMEEGLRLLSSLAQTVAGAPDFDTALHATLRIVCEAAGWALGEAWMPSSDGRRLEWRGAYTTREGLERFAENSRAFTFGPGAGLPGRVWTSRRPLWIPDVTQDPSFPREPLAREFGLRAAVGVPVLAEDFVVAVLCFFLTEVQEEDERKVALISAAAAQLGTAFQRRAAEQALVASEARYRLLVEHTPFGYGIVQDGKWVFLNWTGARMLGAERPEEVVGQEVAEFVHPAFRQREQERMSRALRDRQPAPPEETRFIRPDGSSLEVEITEIPLVHEGKPAVQVIFQDISERKERGRLVQAEALVAEALRDTLEPVSLLERVLQAALQMVPGAEGGFVAVAREDGSLRIRAVHSNRGAQQPGSEVREGKLPDSYRVLEEVLRTPHPTIVDPLPHEPGTSREVPLPRSMAIVPLRTGRHFVGVLALESSRPQAFGEEDLRVLSTMASPLTLVLENAHLLEETARRLRQVQALRNIDLAITASLDPRVTMRVLLEEVTIQLGVDAAAVLLLDPNTLELACAAHRGFRSSLLERSRVRMGSCYAGRAALHRRIYTLTDLPGPEDPARQQLLQEEGFRAYYAAPMISRGRVLGVLETYHRREVEADGDWLEMLEALAGQAAIAVDNARLFDDLERSNLRLQLAYEATIEGWARALELREQATGAHTQRVADLTVRVARRLGVPEPEIVHLRRGAILHDVGKIAVPDHILLKPGPLTEEEWAVMRRHPEYAYELLSPIEYLRPALDIPYAHHERWDGSGYPRGLAGEEIPLGARIFAVVDVYDALISDRPYRRALSQEEAVAYLQEQAGRQFDPRVVEAFLQVLEEEMERPRPEGPSP
ncbi:MAG: GAF domain-containing protein [Armatimonadetes bacterium]|nr:GAF domain-containing protein [Armatimonadota bacterium]MDW8154425.1 GAF domain-containing protein [Armatimonadota bacterium]